MKISIAFSSVATIVAGGAFAQCGHCSEFFTDESFDTVTPPVIPQGWETIGFVTTSASPNSAPNAAFGSDPDVITDKSLFAPRYRGVIHGQLTFRHQVDLESGIPAFDAVVLEVAGVAGGPFFDILDVGGSFVTGGYDHTVFSGHGNPLEGREAWGGTTQGYQEVIVNFPSRLVGCDIFVRWRMGTDDSGAGNGYWLDDVHADDAPPDEYIFAGDFEKQNCLD